jgi:hypothetical protein
LNTICDCLIPGVTKRLDNQNETRQPTKGLQPFRFASILLCLSLQVCQVQRKKCAKKRTEGKQRKTGHEQLDYNLVCDTIRIVH